MLKDLVVKKPEEKPEPEDLAKAIRAISAAVKKMQNSGINRRGIVVLLCHSAKLGVGTVENVLDSLEELADAYTVKVPSSTPVKRP